MKKRNHGSPFRRVSCSGCGGTKWSDHLKCACPDCQGIGSFTHWKDGMDYDQAVSHLDATMNLLRATKEALMDYVSGGREADDKDTQNATMERLRWERDYWAFRVQTLQGEISLMKGERNGSQSDASGGQGTSCGQASPVRA